MKDFWMWIGENYDQLFWVLAVIGLCGGAAWKVYTHFKADRSVTTTSSPQKHSGSGDNVGGDKVEGDKFTGDKIVKYSRDPQDKKTIQTYENTLEWYRKELSKRDLALEERNRLIKELKGALETATVITQSGGPLAVKAQALIDRFIEAPNDPNLLPQLDDLIASYEDGTIPQLIQLYLGRGALGYYSDTQRSLDAYTRVTQLDPKHKEAHNSRGILLKRLGELPEAEAAYHQVLELAQKQNDQRFQATALNNLGLLAKTSGDSKEAETLYRNSLKIYQQIGNKEGIARNYSNLGMLAETSGDSKKAENLYRKALQIHQKIGNKEGIAHNYTHLGILAKTRRNPKEAEKLYREALKINQQIENKEGIASNYCNLGVLAYNHGNSKEAEILHRNALEINQQIENKAGIANSYTNQGMLAETHRNPKEAENLYRKALKINQQIRNKKGIATNYNNLGNLAFHCKDLEEAENFFRKALKINQKIERKEGIAIKYCNLADLAKTLKSQRRHEPCGCLPVICTRLSVRMIGFKNFNLRLIVWTELLKQ